MSPRNCRHLWQDPTSAPELGASGRTMSWDNPTGTTPSSTGKSFERGRGVIGFARAAKHYNGTAKLERDYRDMVLFQGGRRVCLVVPPPL